MEPLEHHDKAVDFHRIDLAAAMSRLSWGRCGAALAAGMVVAISFPALTAASGIKYRRGDNVPLYANKVSS